MKAFPNTGPKMLFMNLSCIASFVISMTGTMTMSLMMILPHLIPMMGILLDMIQTETSSRIAQQLTFASFGYYSEQYPRMQSWPTKLLFTIPEKQGDKTLFINSDQLLFTPTVPQNHEVTICFRLTRQFTRSKSSLPSVIPAISWKIQGSLLLYKASLASVFLRTHKAIQTLLSQKESP